jgi:hypothetical protein
MYTKKKYIGVKLVGREYVGVEVVGRGGVGVEPRSRILNG